MHWSEVVCKPPIWWLHETNYISFNIMLGVYETCSFLKNRVSSNMLFLLIFSCEVGKLYFSIRQYIFLIKWHQRHNVPQQSLLISPYDWMDLRHAVFKLTKLVKQHQGSEVDVAKPTDFDVKCHALIWNIYEQVAACCLIIYSSFMFPEHLFGTLYWSLKILSTAFINTLSSTQIQHYFEWMPTPLLKHRFSHRDFDVRHDSLGRRTTLSTGRKKRDGFLWSSVLGCPCQLGTI